jgi:hypothetical protein
MMKNNKDSADKIKRYISKKYKKNTNDQRETKIDKDGLAKNIMFKAIESSFVKGEEDKPITLGQLIKDNNEDVCDVDSYVLKTLTDETPCMEKKKERVLERKL